MATRAQYTRTSGDMLTAGSYWPPSMGPGVDPSGQPPVVWWNGSDSGGGASPIGPNGPWPNGNAESLAVVNRATSLLVDPIAQSPLRVRELGFGGQPLGTPRWLTDPMLTRPDARYPDDIYPAVSKLPASKFWGDLLRSALWWGLGAFISTLDIQGQPAAGSMRLVHPGLLTTERDASGTLVWTIGADVFEQAVVFDRDGLVNLGGTVFRLTVLRNPASPVDTEGMSLGVFAMSPGAFQLAGRIDGYSSGVFRSGVPSGYLKVSMPGLQQSQADDLKRAWMTAHGSPYQRGVAVLNAVTDYVPISLNPVDAALKDVKVLSIADVAFAFGEDPSILNASLGNSNTYANVRDYFKQHRDLSLGIWVAALQDVLTALLPGTQGVVVDLDQFTRPEPKERYDAYAVALDSGWITLDEIREMEGLPPLPQPVPAPPAAPAPEPPPPTPITREARRQPWR